MRANEGLQPWEVPVTLYSNEREFDHIREFGLHPDTYLPVRTVPSLPMEAKRPVIMGWPGPLEQVWTRDLNRYLSMSGLRVGERIAREAKASGSEVVRLELRLDPARTEASILDRAKLEKRAWFRSPERRAHRYWDGRIDLGESFGHMSAAEVAIFDPVDASQVVPVECWKPNEFVETLREYADYQLVRR